MTVLEKLSNSWGLVQASARVLRSDKELLIFPLISTVTLILVSVSFFVPLAFLGGGLVEAGTEGGSISLAGYGAMFLYYVVTYTIIFFFNSALVGAAMIRLDGGDPTVGDGLRIAASRFKAILGYAVIAATVGLILKAIAERSKLLGRIVTGLFGVAWSLATYLVVPVLVTRDLGPVDAIKESAGLLKKTWGEQVAGNVGIGFVFGLGFVVLALLGVPLVVLAAGTGNLWLVGLAAGGLILAFVLLGLVNAALSGIYSAAVYRFATRGSAGGSFDDSSIAVAFGPR